MVSMDEDIVGAERQQMKCVCVCVGGGGGGGAVWGGGGGGPSANQSIVGEVKNIRVEVC